MKTGFAILPEVNNKNRQICKPMIFKMLDARQWSTVILDIGGRGWGDGGTISITIAPVYYSENFQALH